MVCLPVGFLTVACFGVCHFRFAWLLFFLRGFPHFQPDVDQVGVFERLRSLPGLGGAPERPEPSGGAGPQRGRQDDLPGAPVRDPAP